MRVAFVAGALANRPGNGGGASVRMTWVSALRRLGFDVWFVEQIEPEALQPGSLRFFSRVMARFGLERCSALLDGRGELLAGAPREIVEAAADRAELLVNLGGHLELPAIFERLRRRVYVDLDPGYTQLWGSSADPSVARGARLANHDLYYSVGLNVGAPGWTLPTGGVEWRPLPPPVVIEEWEPVAGPLEMFTTIGAWRGTFGRVEHGGRTFGAKAHEFRRFLELPEVARATDAGFEIALDIAEADAGDREALLRHGWRLVDPAEKAGSPDAYRAYIRRSGAEFSVAQGIYVESASGWISDRTVRYLAAGRPALVQDTGAGGAVPAGTGLLTFRDLDEAAAGALEIARDYPRHRAAARELAREVFDSDRVVGGLLAAAGVPRRSAA